MSDLARLAREAVEALGGHAPAWRVAEHVEAQLSEDDYRDITRAGFVAQVRNALRAKDSDGLPQAVSVGGDPVATPLLYDVTAAGQALSIGRNEIYHRIQTGEIRSVRIGRRRLIPATELAAFVDRLITEAAQ